MAGEKLLPTTAPRSDDPSAAEKKPAKKKFIVFFVLAILVILSVLFPTAALTVLGIIVLFIVWLLYPVCLVKTAEFDMDSVVSWGGKGPAANDPAFPKKLAAPYYLKGNISPDNKTLSPLMMMDFTYCKYDAKTRTMSFDGVGKMGFIVGSANVDPEVQNKLVGTKVFKILAAVGFCYDLVWDEKFENADVLIRTNRLCLFGGTLPLFPTSLYRWTIADVKPDGSAFTRNTWFGGRLNPGKDMYKDPPVHSYYPERLCFDGKLDKKVYAKMTETWKGKLHSGA